VYDDLASQLKGVFRTYARHRIHGRTCNSGMTGEPEFRSAVRWLRATPDPMAEASVARPRSPYRVGPTSPLTISRIAARTLSDRLGHASATRHRSASVAVDVAGVAQRPAVTSAFPMPSVSGSQPSKLNVARSSRVARFLFTLPSSPEKSRPAPSWGPFFDAFDSRSSSLD